jgi:hypothetical protein
MNKPEFIDPTKVEIFDPTTLPKNFSGMIIGKRRTGKSVFLKDMLYKIRKWYKKIFIFSETLHLQPDLYTFIPKENRYNSFNQEALQSIWDTQMSYVMSELEIKPDLDKSKLDHVMIIFDDCINDVKFRGSKILKDLHVMGRHNCIASIILSQTISGKWGIDGVCRQNEDLVVSFMLKEEYNRDLLVEQFLSVENKKIGMKLYRDIVNEDQYQAIVIENYKNSGDYLDFVKKYTAELNIPKFEISDKLIVKKIKEPAPLIPKPNFVTYRIVRDDGSILEI